VFNVQRDLSRGPLRLDDVDASSSSVLLPFYDYDTHLLYLAGKVPSTATHTRSVVCLSVCLSVMSASREERLI